MVAARSKPLGGYIRHGHLSKILIVSTQRPILGLVPSGPTYRPERAGSLRQPVIGWTRCGKNAAGARACERDGALPRLPVSSYPPAIAVGRADTFFKACQELNNTRTHKVLTTAYQNGVECMAQAAG